MIRDELEGIWHILLKDLKAYYFKPPNISWGILFPLVLALAFTLRNPAGLADLAPGLVAMAALVGTTSMEAIVITFEKRVGALERLIMAPVSLTTIVVGKVLGGAVFGLVIAGVMTVISLLFLNITIIHPVHMIAVLILTVLTHSALGALVAVSVKEVFEAQTLSNYFRFPMVFLCGVFMPVEAMPVPIQVIAHLLPLTYAVDAFHHTLRGPLHMSLLLRDVAALTLFLTIFLTLATRLLKKSLD
ncbi:MAG: ABC transporter permease [Candidatus Bathyarchaeota archaeon]|nr:ABC transporter permease [Candidatus Bathyarchaeota archaeon]